MERIIKEFEDFMLKHGTHYNQFYVGIASDPNDRLVNGHSVDETVPNLYWNTPLNTEIVRSIEKYFLAKGAKGGPGGGDSGTTYIYTYLITPRTKE